MAMTGGSATIAGGDADAGAGCARDFRTGLTLCTALAACPGVSVDSDRLPNCGFLLSDSTIDLLCLCADAVCPIGVALTCAQAEGVLSSADELSVCTEASEGVCTPSAQSSAAPPQAAGGCDPSCANACAGDPGCVRICGC